MLRRLALLVGWLFYLPLGVYYFWTNLPPENGPSFLGGDLDSIASISPIWVVFIITGLAPVFMFYLAYSATTWVIFNDVIKYRQLFWFRILPVIMIIHILIGMSDLPVFPT